MKFNLICGLLVIIGLTMIGWSAISMENRKMRQDDEIVRRITEACKR